MSKLFSFSLFFSSFFPLWISILIKDGLNIYFEPVNTYTEWISIILIIIVLFISLLILWLALKPSKSETGENTLKYTITEITEEKAITSEYLLSYILPLFAFDLTIWKDTIQFLIYFGFLALLCIWHNNFSINIALELCGYRFYNASLLSTDQVATSYMVISRRKLSNCKGNEIYLRPIDNNHALDIHTSKNS